MSAVQTTVLSCNPDFSKIGRLLTVVEHCSLDLPCPLPFHELSRSFPQGQTLRKGGTLCCWDSLGFSINLHRAIHKLTKLLERKLRNFPISALPSHWDFMCWLLVSELRSSCVYTNPLSSEASSKPPKPSS